MTPVSKKMKTASDKRSVSGITWLVFTRKRNRCELLPQGPSMKGWLLTVCSLEEKCKK